MQKQRPEFAFQTEPMQMTTTILESIVHNLGSKIGEMQARIEFKSEHQKKEFQMSKERYQKREGTVEIVSGSDDEEMSGIRDVTLELKESRKTAKSKQNADTRSISVTFQFSILLRERYFQKLEIIGKRLSVRFMVVPNKVKIMGWKSDLVDQAEQEFGLIQDKIRFIPIPKGGREIYQSRIYRQLLRDNKVQVVKILNKYYIWYEEGIPDPSEVLRQALSNTTHKMMYLHRGAMHYREVLEKEQIQFADVVLGEGVGKEKRNSTINDLLSQTKATIFEKYVAKEINRLEHREHRKVELSQDKRNLILHLDAEEQIDIYLKTITQKYAQFRFTFLKFDEDVNMEEVHSLLSYYTVKRAAGFKKQKKASDPILYFSVLDQFVCLACFHQEEGSSVSDHQIIKLVNSFPPQLLHLQLAIHQQSQELEQDPEFKKFAFEKDRIEKVTFIRCKNPSAKNYQTLLENYLDNKFEQSKKNFQQNINSIDNELSHSVEFDLSRPVDQSSLMINDSLNISSVKPSHDQSMVKILPSELVKNNTQPTFNFENYDFCLQDGPEDREKRYSLTLDKVKRKELSLSNPLLEKALTMMTKSKYKMHKIVIPVKHKLRLEDEVQKCLEGHPELAHLDRMVTVFHGGKQPKDYECLYEEQHTLKVLRLADKPYIRQGYLLKTNVLLMFLEFQLKSTVQLPYGKYEALFFIRKME